jgi:peptidyl-prolyl cis-trans isomerase C
MTFLPLRLAAGMLALMLGTASAMAQTNPPAATPPATPPAAADTKPDSVVAIVNGKKITRAEVIESAQSLPEQYRNQVEQLFPALVDRMIDITLMIEEGRKENLQNDPDVKKIVALYEDEAIRQVLLDRFLAGKMTDEALRKKYDEMVKQSPPTEELRASHILVKTEDEAKAIIVQLQGGADFAKLAKEKSIDPSAGNGGDLGYFGNGDMLPEFWAAATKLKKGEFTTVPVKTQYGWHIIELTDRRMKAQPKFEDVKDQVKEELKRDLITAWLVDLRKTAKVQKFNPDGTPMPDQPNP